MKMTRIAVAVSTALLASSAFATNGTNMIGLGAQSNAMGGTGVAASYGSETIIANPAMIGKTTGTEFTFGGTYFVPTVKTTNNIKNSASGGAVPVGKGTSTANDTNVVPAVSLSSRINGNLTFGIGMFGTSGMGVDYKDKSSLFNAQTNLQIMKFAPTLSYNTSKFGLGISPILQYGALDISFQSQVHDHAPATATRPNGNPLYIGAGGLVSIAPSNTPLMKTIGSGAASDLGFGYNIGGYFNVTEGLTLGASYLSPISMNYNGQLSTAGKAFGLTYSDKLEQPSEIKVGAEYAFGSFTLNADYKQVAWGSAEGYKDFGWKDQNVVSIGGKYATNKFWVGLGYNHGNSPISEQAQSTTNPQAAYAAAATNVFNNTFFPATTESHFTFGGGYSLTKAVSIEGAVVIAPEVTTTFDTSAVSSAFATEANNTNTAAASSSTTKHSQIGYTFQVKYHF